MKHSTWDSMTLEQRVRAVNIDIMNHSDFCTLTGLVTMGDIHFIDGMPTAGTNGLDVFYGCEFLARQNRKQVRFVQLHESLHKALRHCSDYRDVVEKYPELSNMAMDYVVNGLIEQTDPEHKFIEYTTDPEPLLDPKYYNRSFIDVLQDLLKNPPPQNQKENSTLDEHYGAPEEVDPQELEKQIQDALNHGDMVQKRMQTGSDSGGNPLSGLGVKRDTDWRNALREFIEQVVTGDEYSRYNPPNRRFLAHDILMPTHFDIAMGELMIACDTSGSMGGVYPIVFGEIANICKQANPDKVRVVWWDTQVCDEQVFARDQFEQIADLLKPAGGGGTSPKCVADYIQIKNYKPTAVIWLTDGYLDACPTAVCSNELWGVVNNDHFKPAHGKVLRIHS
jgi:predicted metal-dependent peptidase